MRPIDDIDDPTWHDIFDRDDEIKKLRKQLSALQERRMSWDVDQVEFYETFAEIEADRGIDGAKEWAWSALNWTQQELRRVDALSKDVQQTVINKVEDNVSTTPEMVNHPKHYNLGKFEVIDVIEDWKLGFHLGNTVKYIARAGHKDSVLQDLKKAKWYLDRHIEQLEKQGKESK